MSSIKNVEISSLCNMSCSYCLSPRIKEHREAGMMSLETFKKVVDQIEVFFKAGTQGELWLHGTGEPLLNKFLPSMVKEVKRIPVQVYMSTNGLLIDDDIVAELKDAGIDRIDVSYHDEEIAIKAHKIIWQQGIYSVLNYGPRDSRFNWAGQLDFEGASSQPSCPWIGNQECFVLHDGRIVSCCFDSFGTNVLGHISEDLSKIEIGMFDLCQRCNHIN